MAPSTLVQAVREYKPDLIGLSGLLVRSAHQMIVTAEALSEAGLCPPMLVGGAALTDKFTRTRIAPAYRGPVVYARDVMQGLELANQIMDPAQRQILEKRLEPKTADLPASKNHGDAG